jgi:hypothetical protein
VVIPNGLVNVERDLEPLMMALLQPKHV